MEIEQFDFYGLKVSDFTLSDLHKYYDEVIINSKTIICYGYSFGTIPFFKKYPDLYKIINSFDIMVTDGTYFYWFMKYSGYQLKKFLSIPFMTLEALEYANKHRKSVLLLGADSDTNNTATQNLKNKYPDIHFYDGHNGYFDESEELPVVEFINKCKPDILLIGMSTPKKESFAFKYKNQLACSIIIPCGGMIDVFAGKVKLASPFLKKIGLAAFIRTIQQPRHLLLRNLWLAAEILGIIIPVSFYQIKIKKNRNFFIPGIYNIPRD